MAGWSPPTWNPLDEKTQPIKVICRYHLTQVHCAHTSLCVTHGLIKRIIQCTPGNNSPTLLHKHTHCWGAKSIISKCSTSCHPPTCTTLTWRNSPCASQQQGLLDSGGSRSCRCSLSAPRRCPGFLAALSCVYWQHSNAGVKAPAPLPLKEQVPHLRPEKRRNGISLIYLFIHEKAQTRTNLAECVSLFCVCSWMNKQEQREISCLGSAPVGLVGVRSIIPAWILINWLQKWDELQWLSWKSDPGAEKFLLNGSSTV